MTRRKASDRISIGVSVMRKKKQPREKRFYGVEEFFNDIRTDNGEEEEEPAEGDAHGSLMQYQTLGLSIIALLCGIFNLVEVIANDRVSFPLLAVMFAIAGVWTTVAAKSRKTYGRAQLAFGIFWFVLALAFTVLWILELCGVIK